MVLVYALNKMLEIGTSRKVWGTEGYNLPNILSWVTISVLFVSSSRP